MPPRIPLIWDHSSAGETGFRIERSPNGSTSWIQIGTTPANVTTYQDAGLAPFTTYYYRVRAFNAAGASTYSRVVSATTR
jgi:titin